MDEEAMLTSSVTKSRQAGLGFLGWVLFVISWLMVVVTFPFSLCVLLKVVLEYERAVIFRLGRLLPGGAKGPGLFIVLPCIESYKKVDLRTITLGVPPQELLTKTSLRNILGTKNLHEILSDRDSISGAMQSILDEATVDWGIKVERVEIKDARLPENLQRAMAAEAEAAREARAKVIAAKGEQKASRALRDASETLSESPAALHLRYLQTLNSISAEKNSTIIFPFPIDLVNHLLGPKKGPKKRMKGSSEGELED